METLNLFFTREVTDLSTILLPLREWFSGMRSLTLNAPMFILKNGVNPLS
jgi:hypothetical protein